MWCEGPMPTKTAHQVQTPSTQKCTSCCLCHSFSFRRKKNIEWQRKSGGVMNCGLQNIQCYHSHLLHNPSFTPFPLPFQRGKVPGEIMPIYCLGQLSQPPPIPHLLTLPHWPPSTICLPQNIPALPPNIPRTFQRGFKKLHSWKQHREIDTTSCISIPQLL